VGWQGFYNTGTLNTDDGNDIITGLATSYGDIGGGIYNTTGTIETGNGNDIITGLGEASESKACLAL
jgi:hypothetical protein